MKRPALGEPWAGAGGASPQQLHGLENYLEHVPDNRQDCHYLGGGIISHDRNAATTAPCRSKAAAAL